MKHDGQRLMMSLAAPANDLQKIVLLKKVLQGEFKDKAYKGSVPY